MNDCEQLENLEDIESRLYSELYHNVEAYQDPTQTTQQPVEETSPAVVPEMRRAPPRPRYFQHVLNGQPRLEAPSPPDPPQKSLPVQTDFSPTMAQLLSHCHWVPTQTSTKAVAPAKASRRQRKRDNRKLRKSLMKNPAAFVDPSLQEEPKQENPVFFAGPSTQNASTRGTHTIFLSDSDDDVIEVKPEPQIPINCEDGSDVIFIPNPPPEVITLDEDTEAEKIDSSISSHPSETSKNSAEKDDFITALDIELNHRPQFGEFDKPEFLKPTQVTQTPCGSESTSSCTIDLTALQAGPFTEHEFPQNNALLFEDENLESFGNLITPNRRDRESTPKSDLESSEAATPLSSKFKKLPTLSHIEKHAGDDSDQEPPAPPAKITKRKSSQDDASKKSLKSKKKKHKAADENEPEQEETREEAVTETRKKSKKKSQVAVEEVESEETPKKSRNKRRDTNDALGSFVVVDEETNESKAGKKRQVVIEEDEADESPRKSRNKKREMDDALGSFVVLDEVNESVVVSSSESDDCLSELQGGDVDIQLLNCSPHLLHGPVQIDESPAKDPSVSIDLLRESVDDVLSRMSNDPGQWRVLESDRLRLRTKGTGRRCNRCREVGHVAIRCPNNVSPKCNLCGAEHYEARCPDKMCTGCGRSQGFSSSYCKHCFDYRHRQCEICWNDGHVSRSCPDLWRRYHLTTEEGPLVRHQGPSCKPKNQLWCSGCAKSGHLVHECRVFINSDYPKSDPFIRSYTDIYNANATDDERNNYEASPPSDAQQYRMPSLLLPNEFQQNFYFNQNYCGGGGGGGGTPQGQYNVNFYNNAQNYQNTRPNNAQIQLIQALIPQNNVTFHDQLPNYINLNSCGPQSRQQQQQQPAQHKEQENFVSHFADNSQSNMSPAERRLFRNAQSNMVLFFKKPLPQIQQFVHAELRKLDKYVDNLKGIVGDLRRNIGKQGRNYRNLNMVLFGVYHLNDGNLHLEKLRNFRSCHPRAPLSIAKRKELFKAYNYIFGADGHESDNQYKDLLLNAI